jgi:hypothetical protein
VQSLRVKAASNGRWDAVAVIRNSAATSRSGSFVFTVFRRGAKVAELTGASNPIAAQNVTTVRLSSSDPYRAGPFTYTFKATFGF